MSSQVPHQNPSEFEFFCKAFYVHLESNSCFIVGSIVLLPSSVDYIFIMSNLYRKHLMPLIVLVSMFSWFTMTFRRVQPKRSTWGFVSLLHWVVSALTHCFHVRISSFLISGILWFWNLMVYPKWDLPGDILVRVNHIISSHHHL